MTPKRDLGERELLAVVRGVAARPAAWRHLVAHDHEQRRYEELVRDDRVSVWLICWSDDQDTGFHDHDLSAGALTVVRGQVCEERLVLGGAPASRTLLKGESLAFNASDIHRVSHTGTGPAVTLHAYSPPLWRMGAYEVSPDGTLRRHSMSYAEELRPLAA
jgi:predicted metal-dependent enzyme (double-stranded beta helix superfamily)